MAPFSVAPLKEKLSNAKSTSFDRFQSVRDKYTGVSSAESSHRHRDLSNQGPPPSPPRAQVGGVMNTSQSTATQDCGPPPIRRSTRPAAPPTLPMQSKGDHSNEEFKWASIRDDDKRLLFSWFDEFFETPGRRPVRSSQPPGRIADDRNAGLESHELEEAKLSLPPRLGPGSAARDLSNFFSQSTYWDAPWYTSSEPTPPPLASTTDCIRTHSMRWTGDTRTLSGGVLFSDLSACWYTVTWTDGSAYDTSHSRRTTAFLPMPDALSREELIAAHETYGETVASFAEGYEGTGQWCARGECWDLANEALKGFEQWDYVPKPLPSIGMTHGHLIYSGNVWGRNVKTDQVGQWRGGDDLIRRGDIVQWKSVKIIDGNRQFFLGSPDHTAIIVRDQQPKKPPLNGQAVVPAELGSIEVVEQSVHSPPARQTYNLSGMVSGEVWIYRPVGIEAYLKFVFSATCPEGL